MGQQGIRKIEVVDYDCAWPHAFETLCAEVWPAISDIALAIEPVGSTSVQGLAAKPIIDLDIVVATRAQMPGLIARLEKSGYRHEGDLGITGREAFQSPPGAIAHHLYACAEDCLAVGNHLVIREQLRADSRNRDEYSALKQRLAKQFPSDIASYIRGKTNFVLKVLGSAGFSDTELDLFAQANRT